MRRECPTKLLSDHPASKDAFGSHNRVARAIATLLQEEEGGRAIALTGSWGSGKSTVVQLLQSYLPTKSGGKSVGVFVYDAWVHQGDPLRRSFLETLTSFLAKQGWILPDKWQDALDSLSRRREETTSESQPLLTWPGRLMALSALLLPLGYTLFSKYGDSQVIAGIPIWIVGLLLSLSPLLIAILTWISWRPTWRVWTSEFWTQHRAPHEKDSVVSFFVSKIREVNRSHTIRTPDPTSIEFQGLFHDILDDALGKNKRTLLIVMDNLDRIPPQEALSIWSTMRTFFHTDNPRNSDWLSRFWLLVPFDRSALQRLWNTNENGPDDLVTAFVNKSFQIEFRVSQPVLSDWKKFFFKQLTQAFPEHAENTGELNIIYHLFRLKGLPADRPLTPRDIKLFINKVGALHRQWGDQIPLVMQSLYVLCEKDIRFPSEDLTKDDFLKPLVKGVVSNYEWQKYLAALHFNVDPKKALEVLIGRIVEEAFSAGEFRKLDEFRDIPGFRDVCDLVLEENHQNWAEEHPASIALAALVLKKITSGGEEWGDIWKWLLKGVGYVEQWTDLNTSVGQGIVSILQRCPDDNAFADTAKKILSALTRDPKLTEVKGKRPEKEDVYHWVDACLQVVSAIEKRDSGRELILEHFRVPGSAETYLAALDYLQEQENDPDKSLLQYFKPENPNSVINKLVEFCNKDGLGEQHAKNIETMITIGEIWPWSNLINAIASRLDRDGNLSSETVKGSTRAILLLAYKAENSEARSKLGDLTTRNRFSHYLGRFSHDPRVSALCLLPMFEINPDTYSRNNQAFSNLCSNPKNNKPLLESFVDLIIEFEKADLVLKHGKEISRMKNLATAILEEIISSDKAPRCLSAKLIIEEYQTVFQLLPEETRAALVEQLVSQGDLISALMKNDFSPELGQLYLDAFRASKGDNQLAAFLKSALKAFDTKTWLNELLEGGPFLVITLLFIEKGEPLDLAAAFHDALREHAQKIRVGKATSPSIEAEKWATLVGAMEDHWQETFIRNLWDDLIREPDKPIDTVCSLYGDRLLELKPSRGKADEIVRRVYSGILKRGNIDELKWLAKALGAMQELYKAASGSTRKSFEDRVRNVLLSPPSEEARTIFEDIARKVDLDPNEASQKKEQ